MDISRPQGNNLTSIRPWLVNRWVGGIFLLLTGGFAVTTIVLENAFTWPFMELGRQTSFFLGCGTLVCMPLALIMGFGYMYLFAVLINLIVVTTTRALER